jgi:hypothetical protein
MSRSHADGHNEQTCHGAAQEYSVRKSFPVTFEFNQMMVLSSGSHR